MRLQRFLRAMAPIAAMAFATALSGCDHAGIEIDGEKGKPLAELDMSGTPPHELALFGPDKVEIKTGDHLAITVDGLPEKTELLRFTLKDGKLGILRKNKMLDDDEPVTIHVTMPPPEQLTMGGSGKIVAETMASKAEVAILGSGNIETGHIAADSLSVSIAGSGSYLAGGTAKSLDLNIAGSGNAAMEGLKADAADISIAGSGNSHFASDGKVKASILGSGEVRVSGRATCTISAVGSGRLICDSPTQGAKDEGKDDDDGN
jgi:hypothetical protein